MRTIVIVAGDYFQAKNLMRDMDLSPLKVAAVTRIDDLYKLQGLERPVVIFTGTWYGLHQIDRIRQEVLARRGIILENTSQ